MYNAIIMMKILTSHLRKMVIILCYCLIFFSAIKLCGQPVNSFLSESILIDQTFTKTTSLYLFEKVDIIYSLDISGDIILNTSSSLARVVLIDQSDHEYLVFEAYPRIVKNPAFSFTNVSEETIALKGIDVKELRIEIIDASIYIADIANH